MNKKKIRQMNVLLLRRLQKRPAGDYFARQKELLQGLERENYMQRFAPLLDGGRVQCAQVLELCRGELEQLCPQTPREGWLLYTFDYARQQLFPEQGSGYEQRAAESFQFGRGHLSFIVRISLVELFGEIHRVVQCADVSEGPA